MRRPSAWPLFSSGLDTDMDTEAPRDLERDVEILAEVIRARYHKGQDEEEWRADVEETFDELNLDL
jgi:hypothetical protein